MPQVQLAEDLYNEAQRRAAEEGFASVDDFISVMLTENLRDDIEEENFDDRFTPEVIAFLDQTSAEMQAGNSVSDAEIDKHLADVREAWLKNHGR